MDDRFCVVCSLDHNDVDAVHNSTPLHRFNFLLFEWQKYRKALVRDRHGIEVKIQPRQVNGHLYNYTEHIQKGNHCLKITPENLSLHGNSLEFLCTVKNIRNKDSVLLTSAKLLHPYKLYSLYDPHDNLEQNKILELEPRAEYAVVVKFNPEKPVIGSYKIPISFSFQTIDVSCDEQSDNFTIARAIIVSVEEEIIEEEETGRSPFTKHEWPPNVEVFPSTRPQKQFDSYRIPSDMHVFFKYGLQEFQGMGRDAYIRLDEIKREMEPGNVTASNYRQFWHNVLWLEEMGQALMLTRYNMENVTLNCIGANMLELEVPGLAEKRPSVIVGDMIDIRVHDDHRAYRGVIKNVNDKTVDIAHIDEELLNYIKINPTMEMDVRFILSRLPLERMHQGVDQTVINQIVPYLFPKDNLVNRQVPQTRTLRDSEFYNQMIVNNEEQKTAVLKILNHTSMGVPYIVFGPPGTGKTVTIVEAILQLKKKTTNNILVCAPANAACDMLTEKLMVNCTNRELIRIVSETVDKSNINQHILEYTNYKEDGDFHKIQAGELREYRIVVTTLILVGRFTRKYHPDVVFIDEAAQACEPEVNCALGMIDRGKQIVLAGDPRQLGPSTSSKVARTYGLEDSLLQRLMALDLYQTQNANFITMLKQNFRSHSMILKLPNLLFYENQLQAMSVKSENDPLTKIFVFEKVQGVYKAKGKKGKKKAVPGQAVEFCSILSKECREGRSPSYFNIKEMQTVLKYVQALTQLSFEDDDDRVLPEQIGIVTPYIRQVYKIRDLFRRNNIQGVEVGTTETFQGREKRVIIISTVRAQHDLLLYDKKYNLGFVKHEKRFNVAVTRAMSKLIIIGCAHVLATDSNWLAYMDLCESVNAFCGVPHAKRTQNVIDEITSRMGRVQFRDSQHNH